MSRENKEQVLEIYIHAILCYLLYSIEKNGKAFNVISAMYQT